MNRPSLIIQTVYFDKSDRDAAYQLGSDLYELLTRPSDDAMAYGPGILVYRAVDPEFVEVDAADDLIILPVLGMETHMMEGSRNKTLETIQEWHDTLGSGHIIPVPTSTKWRAEETDLPGMSLLTELYENDFRRLQTLDEIVLATLRLLDPDRPKTSLFVSHAKADRKETKDAAKAIHDYVLNDTTGSAFFDVNDLGAGRSIQEQIDESLTHGVFVSIRTDNYSSRDWCQKELLLAKKNALPNLTVEILKKGESLSSPYGGNGPTMLWSENPQAVVSRAMVECLRAAHFRKEAARTIQGAALPSDTLALCRPPELLDLAQGPINMNRAQAVIYPDPELPTSHRELLTTANPHLTLVTPTTAFRRIGKERSSVTNPFDGLQVALSLSNSPDVDGPEGYSEDHVVDATIYLARSMISAGARIAYGGDFRISGYTQILANLISAYRQTAGGDDMLHSYLSGSIPIADAPDELPINANHMSWSPLAEDALLPKWSSTAPPDIPIPLYFSDMRRVMAKRTDARVVLGGDCLPRIDENGQNGYGGRYPGVVEEAWRSLQIKQPLYIAGGFGGAAGIVAELVEGLEIPEAMRDATWTVHTSFKTRADTIDKSDYHEKLNLPRTMGDLAAEVRKLGMALLANDDESLAWNGLTVVQNRELLRSRDPVAIATLVFKGLQKVSRLDLDDKIEIELVHGSITAVRDIDAIAIGAFDDLPLGGAGADLDDVMAGRVTLARAGGQQLIGLESGNLGANWLYLASLGSYQALDEVTNLANRVEDAGRHTADHVLRHGFSRLGVVAFGGTMIEDLSQTTKALIKGFEALAGQTTVVWFEDDDLRFDTLLKILKKDVRVKVTTRRLSKQASMTPVRVQQQMVLSVTLEDGRLTSRAMLPRGTGVGGIYSTSLTSDEMNTLSKGDPGRRTPNAGTLEHLGTDLASRLLGLDAKALLTACPDAKVTVFHDVPSSQLPFESLLAMGDDAPIRPAMRGGINRRLAISSLRLNQLVAKPPHTGRLKVLLVVNPLNDLEGADKEGEAVQKALVNNNKIELLELWHKQATAKAFLDNLAKADVLHYCGHAFYDGPGEEESGLNLYGPPLFFTDFRGHNFPVRLVFVNACESGRVRAKNSPQAPDVPESASFAEYFLRSGIEAYLGTYWKVEDDSAAGFAATVYKSLAIGESLDQAVRNGREKLFKQGKNEWANYILYGEGQFRLVRS